MSDHDFRREMRQTGREPLLLIEKKLIAGSLAFGLVLLVALALASRFLAW